MDYPEYVKVNDKKYKINTDFRIAIKCNTIALDDDIEDYERGLAIICVLFEEQALYDALEDIETHKKLLELAQKYLGCGKEIDNNQKNEEPDFDFEQDMNLIRISFMSDYNGLDIKNEEMHFWEFIDRINGLSNSEMGSCCVLNRVRNLRNFDLKTIKDTKEREKIKKAKESVALKRKEKKKDWTEEEKNNVSDFLKQLRKE